MALSPTSDRNEEVALVGNRPVHGDDGESDRTRLDYSFCRFFRWFCNPMTPLCPVCAEPMKPNGRAFQCEPCRQIIIFLGVLDALPYLELARILAGATGS
jgi:hypothetical protein